MKPIAVKGDTQGGDARVVSMHQLPDTDQRMGELVNDDYSYAELQQDLADIIETAELEQDLANIIDAEYAEEGKQQIEADEQEQRGEEPEKEQEEEKLPKIRSTTIQSTRSTESQKEAVRKAEKLGSGDGEEQELLIESISVFSATANRLAILESDSHIQFV